MAVTNSPNMSLPIPGVGSEGSPNYALDLNASLTLIDQHDHSSGRGVQVTPSGLNINANLSFQTNAATALGYASFNPQAAPITSVLQSLYVAPGTESPPAQDLWYTDSNGTAIQLTSGGTVNATIGSLPGESYAAGTFFWKQGSGSTTPANFDIGSITLRPNSPATSFGVILGPPSAIASQYNVSLPLLPASARVLSIDNSGVMATGIAGTVQAVDLDTSSVTTAKIADQNVTQVKLAPRAITNTTVAAGGVGQFGGTSAGYSTVGTTTIVTGITITTTGRPVMIYLSGPGGGGSGNVTLTAVGTASSHSITASFNIKRDTTNTVATVPYSYTCGTFLASNSPTPSTPFVAATSGGAVTSALSISTSITATGTNSVQVAYPGFMAIDPVAAGTYVYTVTLDVNSVSAAQIFLTNPTLTVYEL